MKLCHCCPAEPRRPDNDSFSFSRRSFLTGMAAGGALLSNLSWSALVSGAETEEDRFQPMPLPRKPLLVQPILIYDSYQRREMTTWRGWGGIDSKETADREVEAISKELASIKKSADFPVEFFPVASANDINQTRELPGVKDCDLLLIYGAGGGIQGAQDFGKDVIIFQRWKSGPVYLQYEIVSPRFLRQHTDTQVLSNIRTDDIVTDSLDELTWRLRALCGLKNTRDSRIVTIGRPDAWSQTPEAQEELFKAIREKWRLDIQTVDYEKLDSLLEEASKDESLQTWARQAAEQYLTIPGTKLETEKDPFVRSFILDTLFRTLMREADCRAITVFGCMVTIIPKAKTTACMALSTLNDDGYLAFCESDFAVIPAGILLANISGHPVFMNDPTYPHDGIITEAHCTAPRKMDGKNYEPVRIVTHFESDFGAAPKVDMRIGEIVTHILPDFKSKRWAGFLGEIAENPFRPICRSQIDVTYKLDDLKLAERMPGFHWMLSYGDYMKEIGYALRRVGIEWDPLS